MKVSNLLIILSLYFLMGEMNFKHKIIQWNCQGLKPKFDEISIILEQHKPSIFCLQETFLKVSNGAKIRNRYNQVPHLTQDTNGKVTNSQKTPQTRAKRSALSQQVTTKHI